MTITSAHGSVLRRFVGRVLAGTLLMASVAVPGLTLGTASQTIAADQVTSGQSELYLAGGDTWGG